MPKSSEVWSTCFDFWAWVIRAPWAGRSLAASIGQMQDGLASHGHLPRPILPNDVFSPLIFVFTGMHYNVQNFSTRHLLCGSTSMPFQRQTTAFSPGTVVSMQKGSNEAGRDCKWHSGIQWSLVSVNMQLVLRPSKLGLIIPTHFWNPGLWIEQLKILLRSSHLRPLGSPLLPHRFFRQSVHTRFIFVPRRHEVESRKCVY